MQIIPVQKFKLLFWMQVIKAVAEKVNFLLYEPAPQILPLKVKKRVQLYLIYTHKYFLSIFKLTTIILTKLQIYVWQ